MPPPEPLTLPRLRRGPLPLPASEARVKKAPPRSPPSPRKRGEGWGEGRVRQTMRRSIPLLASPLTWVAVLFAALLVGMPLLHPVFHWGFPLVSPPVFGRSLFVALWLSHAGLVAVASLAATLLGVGL